MRLRLNTRAAASLVAVSIWIGCAEGRPVANKPTVTIATDPADVRCIKEFMAQIRLGDILIDNWALADKSEQQCWHLLQLEAANGVTTAVLEKRMAECQSLEGSSQTLQANLKATHAAARLIKSNCPPIRFDPDLLTP